MNVESIVAQSAIAPQIRSSRGQHPQANSLIVAVENAFPSTFRKRLGRTTLLE
jgi:hypothetical protein